MQDPAVIYVWTAYLTMGKYNFGIKNILIKHFESQTIKLNLYVNFNFLYLIWLSKFVPVKFLVVRHGPVEITYRGIPHSTQKLKRRYFLPLPTNSLKQSLQKTPLPLNSEKRMISNKTILFQQRIFFRCLRSLYIREMWH